MRFQDMVSLSSHTNKGLPEAAPRDHRRRRCRYTRAKSSPSASFNTSPTTAARFPRGEAAHYREHAMALGVPADAILVDSLATNTGQNIELSRELLSKAGSQPRSLLLISKPYMQRRAYATCRQRWAEVDPVCASEPLEFEDYMASIGDAMLVLDMLVGDLQRVVEYPKRGFAIKQEVPTRY